jgi:AAHS family 4-hydroxybenzoate transporter-like MFS transporter
MKTVDVNALLDRESIRGLPLLVIVCATLILILDGLDIQILSLVAPLLTREFHLSPASLGPLLASALVGMAIGGFLLGGFGDRWGRRPLLLFSVALFAGSTLLAARAQSISELGAWRLLTGIGLGGAIPNAMALLAEFTGPRWRTQAVAAAVIGVPIGGMSGGAIAVSILPLLGWRAMLFVGGLLPAVAFVALFFVLPESPRYLATQPGGKAALAVTLNRLSKKDVYTADDTFLLSDPVEDGFKAGFFSLLDRPLFRDTCSLWLLFLTNMFTIYTFFSWTPVILNSLNLSLSVAVRGSIVFNLAGVCGGVASAWLISSAGSRWPTAVMALVGIIMLWLISRLLLHASESGSSVNIRALLAAIGVVGFVMIGIQTSAYRLSTHLYTTRTRSSGVGWAASFGRIGGILSSLIGGWILAHAHGDGFFVTLAGVVFMTLLCVLMIRHHLEPSR